MTGKFLVDANLPVALAAQLSGSGVDCVHVADRADVSIPDKAIWQIAITEGRTIISRDGDFAHLVAGSSSGPSVIWVRLGNVRKQVLLNRMHRDWTRIVALLSAGERLIELR